MADEQEILRAVAATLRKVADWIEHDRDRGILLEMAERVEQEGALTDYCCPVCEEVTCDSDCPLAVVRGQAVAADCEAAAVEEIVDDLVERGLVERVNKDETT